MDINVVAFKTFDGLSGSVSPIGINKLRKSDHLKYKYLWLIIILFTSYLGLVFCILFIKKYDNLDKN